MLQFTNLINGTLSTEGDSFNVFSPIDQHIFGEAYAISKENLNKIFEKSKSNQTIPVNLRDLDKLAKYIKENKKKFIENIIYESGYTVKDSEEIVEGVVEFINFFEKYICDTEVKVPESKFSYEHVISRSLKISSKPYGVVAVMTPQNGPLTLEITILLNALASGNSVILRPSSQCVGIAALLIEALKESFSSEMLQKISIVSCKATDFLSVSYEKADLLHYIGSSGHGKRILADALSNNKKALVDGEGASTMIIDKTAQLKEAVKSCRDGIIRCNGQLCSTIRTIVVHDDIYEEFVSLLANELKNIKPGNPLLASTELGPLFNEKQAEQIRLIGKKYKLLSGDLNTSSQGLNYMTPLLFELKPGSKDFLFEDVFGPITGVVVYKEDQWKEWLNETPYKLNDAVFSEDEEFIKEFLETSQSPRKVVNHDPTIESVFEPWGAFLPSGSNDVSYWYDKYRRSYQVVIESK